MARKLTDKQKMMEMKTSSDIPKTPQEKKRWIRARQIVAKETGRYSEGEIPWALVTHIYQSQQKAGKTAKASDVKKAKVSKTVRKYKTERSPERKAAVKSAKKTMKKRGY